MKLVQEFMKGIGEVWGKVRVACYMTDLKANLSDISERGEERVSHSFLKAMCFNPTWTRGSVNSLLISNCALQGVLNMSPKVPTTFPAHIYL